ncbi:cytochrome-c oxidase, cbb3-type subunit III [Aquabacterium sp.]|uniref:cytochrome-c oxidase, cbb3-type subunit III n=1 Tax=Aquabacterium sp. TaxID=1872578 RepID=UPI002C1813B4|nr:cytochrome-c oxidase, cbb3-type subunit III [Aquabacterium sp.]HSW05921.1 cytochrome-c oxidase, cbb3-type subunit III [Aquabacterium sp.]
MSDFFHSGWSIYIAGVTIAGLVACLALLVIAARRRVMAGDNTTGHVWDEDLRELNNPLPRWWMWLFVLTVVFSAIYLALYPGLGSVRGALQWTSTLEHSTEQAQARAATAPLFAGLAAKPAAELARDPRAMALGERLFANNCATCHGADARGSKGFPNLTDTDWLWGGSPERIEETITQGRQGVMPPMAAAIGNADDVRNVANYVLSLSGSPHNSIAANLGRDKFAACGACHGTGGKGTPALGAPNLADKVWLHGWGEDAIVAMINRGKTNVMPAHASRLSREQIHVLGAYVWSLSNTGAP